jgi:diacylglycerol kinase (ATP)
MSDNPDAEILFVVNRSAGSGLAGRCWDRLTAMLPADVRMVASASHTTLESELDAALGEGTRRLVAVGGDGTFHHLTNYVMARELGAGVAVGLIPAGTGSDLARTLGLPQQPHAALERVRSGSTRPFDLLAVDLGTGLVRYAANVASFGISAAVAADVRAQARRRRYSYFTAAVRQLLKGGPLELSIRGDGRAWIDGSVWLVAAANCASFGGGMRVAPHARPDDGALDCIVVRGTGKLRLIRQLPKVYFGTHLSSPDVASARMQQLEIEPARGGVWHAELDGENYDARIVSVRVLPGAIRVIV